MILDYRNTKRHGYGLGYCGESSISSGSSSEVVAVDIMNAARREELQVMLIQYSTRAGGAKIGRH